MSNADANHRKDLFMISRIALVATLVTCLTAASARAQDAAPKIAVVNPARCFAEMRETKDLKQKLEQDQQNLKKEVESRQQKVKDLMAARDLLKPDSAQYQDADKTFMK